MRLKDLIYETKVSIAVLQDRLDKIHVPDKVSSQAAIIRNRLKTLQSDLDVFSLALDINGSRHDLRVRKARRRTAVPAAAPTGHRANVPADAQDQVQSNLSSDQTYAEFAEGRGNPIPIYIPGSRISSSEGGDFETCTHGKANNEYCPECALLWTERLGEKPL